MSLREIAMSRPPRRPSTPQLDLFANGARPPRPAVPTWPMLPDQTRRTLTGLVTRLLIAHAGAGPVEPTDHGDDV
jgi:hypothetical protein